jgi:SulP family sulfate permease
VLERYSAQLHNHGGKLMIAGVNPKVKTQLDRTETSNKLLGAENVFISATTLGASTREAYQAAERWLREKADSNRVADANKETA